MDSKNLSSNWKQLQAKLAAEKGKSPSKPKDETKKQPAPKSTSKTTKPGSTSIKSSESKKRKIISSELEAESSKKRTRRDTDSTVPKKRNRPSMEESQQVNGAKNDAQAKPSASLALWAEDNDISPKALAEAYGGNLTLVAGSGGTKDVVNEGLSKTAQIGKYISLDCEMVEVESGRSALARVSIVNYHGHQIYDSFVIPQERVTDWRTPISGVSPASMKTARTFATVQTEVSEIMEGRILIGHAVKHDLEVLLLSHPRRDLRDTSRLPEFRKLAMGKTPGLRKLAREVLGVEIQGGEHSSVEDARATMLLFRKFKDAFDRENAKKFPGAKAAAGQDGEGSKKNNAKKKKKKKGKK
ncbi:ribonuclease H-like protein [Xylona heveae TC161]|uniref:RNA exonuclease 4 n=1 Tax=Xylona heveae (strain CBS 132557 / TC161) TaxID=1328760 RepID=A0A165HBG0_XYLHT|nr:ribonuclease H-like protein [Xylona heveae TC161]KZF23254.1 ribonuclease H-like protein [Xylona heveae TC161]